MPSPVLDRAEQEGWGSLSAGHSAPQIPTGAELWAAEGPPCSWAAAPAAGGSGDRLGVLSAGNVAVTKQAPSRIIADCKRSPRLSGISDVLLNCKSHYLHRSVGAQPSEN